ncbi:MAG: hypothetical protein HY784_15850, partial [Chloroflexi bacterium]|nr:hypothetical protein [Chloroflexota bacterium]
MLGGFALTQRHAGPDEIAFGLAQVGLPFGQPTFGPDQQRPAQERALVPAAHLPLLQSGPQPLLPGAKGAVCLHPLAQPPPTSDQRLVDDLHCLLPGWVAVGHQQPGVGQPPRQGPVLAQVGARRQAADILRPLAGAHDLHEDAPRLLLFGLTQSFVGLVGVTRQGPFHMADRVVSGVGQLLGGLLVPERGQRELKQREVARLIAHIVEQAFHQTGLEGYA